MEPWEIVISESQERMLAIVEPTDAEEVLRIAERFELVAAVIGCVAGHGDLRILHEGEIAGSVPARHLADAPFMSAKR
jgi:phosphoribosylformylglycinamidine synthase